MASQSISKSRKLGVAESVSPKGLITRLYPCLRIGLPPSSSAPPSLDSLSCHRSSHCALLHSSSYLALALAFGSASLSRAHVTDFHWIIVRAVLRHGLGVGQAEKVVHCTSHGLIVATAVSVRKGTLSNSLFRATHKSRTFLQPSHRR